MPAVLYLLPFLLLLLPLPLSSGSTQQHGQYGQQQHHDYCVVGAGLAGLQFAYFLQARGRDYIVFERDVPGSFFDKFPRHRRLISINKRHTGRGGSSLAAEYNLRHDWHSLLSGVQVPAYRSLSQYPAYRLPMRS